MATWLQHNYRDEQYSYFIVLFFSLFNAKLKNANAATLGNESEEQCDRNNVWQVLHNTYLFPSRSKHDKLGDIFEVFLIHGNKIVVS